MDKDLYKILNIQRDATDDEIKRAFKKLALKYHPDKNENSNAEEIFKEILYAYEVLLDKEKRARHDEIYDIRNKDSPIYYDLYVSLEEIYKGCIKKMKITRKIIGVDGQLCNEEKILNVTIKPGCMTGAKIIFPKEGHKIPGKVPSDIIFIVNDKPHSTFQRDGSNVKYEKEISLYEDFNNLSLCIPTLQGDITLTRNNSFNKIIDNTFVTQVQGQGLPFPNDPSKYGDLLVSFVIMYNDNDRIKYSRRQRTQTQNLPNYYILYVNLEEIDKGCIKKVKVSRNVYSPPYKEDKLFKISISPGLINDTRIVFMREGDQNTKKIPADVIFIVRDKPHPLFVRQGINMTYMMQVNNSTLLSGGSLNIPTLHGDIIKMIIHNNANHYLPPKITVQIPGRGLPDQNHPTIQRGDFFVICTTAVNNGFNSSANCINAPGTYMTGTYCTPGFNFTLGNFYVYNYIQPGQEIVAQYDAIANTYHVQL